MSGNQNSSREQGMEQYFFRASAEDFKKIPGSLITYWLSDEYFFAFANGDPLYSIAKPVVGLQTGDNEAFIRFWQEVSVDNIGFNIKNRDESVQSGKKWFPYTKGGDFRKWYGNNFWVVDWEMDGQRITEHKGAYPRNKSRYFSPGLAYTNISSGNFAARHTDSGFIFDQKGSMFFDEINQGVQVVACLLHSACGASLLNVMCPTLDFNPGTLSNLPVLGVNSSSIKDIFYGSVEITKRDWDSYETSWDFASLPLLHPDYRHPTLKASYQSLRTHWREMTLEMQRLEEENNRIFIDAYGLQDELTPEVPLAEITLTCNPHYRYGGAKSEDEQEALLRADTMRELVSYAVGCMFGRYSLDKPGLILANQGDTLADYLAQVPQPRFLPDDDNVIPILDGDWFADDITLRVRQFLRVAFGEAHYEDNLAFLEQALNVKGKRNYGLRDYLLGEFYADHVKRYKKRPIYWMFSSPKGSFNALIYMHRYRPDTVSVVLRYLRDYREKLATEKERQVAISINPASSQGDKTRALKETDRLAKVLAELEDYERDVLYPLATRQVQIDLDDGVKVNYLKFEGALKKIPGLAAKDED